MRRDMIPATSEDYDQLYALYTHKSVVSYMSFEIMEQDDFRPIFDSFLKESEVFVLTDSDTIVATARLAFHTGPESHTVELCSLAVHPEHRRKGNATALMQKLEAHIKEKYPHIRRMLLGVDSDNPGARRLYNRMEYRPEVAFKNSLNRRTGPKKHLWYNDETMMCKTLGQLNCENKPETDVRLLSAVGTVEKGVIETRSAVLSDLFKVPNSTSIYVYRTKGKKEIANFSIVLGKEERRLGQVVYLRKLVFNSDCTNNQAADFIRQLCIGFHKKGRRRFDIDLPETSTTLRALFESLGFENMGAYKNGYYVPEDDACCDLIAYEKITFNLNDARKMVNCEVADGAVAKALGTLLGEIDTLLKGEEVDVFEDLSRRTNIYRALRRSIGQVTEGKLSSDLLVKDFLSKITTSFPTHSFDDYMDAETDCDELSGEARMAL